MTSSNDCNIDDETVATLRLRLSDKHINAGISPNARVFRYPGLPNVFIMESDLYGNVMPKDSCFLAFNGTHGLMGKHLKIETLKNLGIEDIRRMVAENNEG
jgi:hypothetical protein